MRFFTHPFPKYERIKGTHSFELVFAVYIFSLAVFFNYFCRTYTNQQINFTGHEYLNISKTFCFFFSLSFRHTVNLRCLRLLLLTLNQSFFPPPSILIIARKTSKMCFFVSKTYDIDRSSANTIRFSNNYFSRQKYAL